MDILEFKEGRGHVVKGFEQIPEILAVFNADKRSGKSFYHKTIDYVYLVYSPSSPFYEFFLDERKKEYQLLRGEDPKEIESNPKVVALISKYVDIVANTFLKRSLRKVRADIEQLHRRISDIPFEIPVKVEMDVDVPEFRDSRTMVKVPVKQTVMLDNSREKKAAIDMFDKLYELYDKLNNRARNESESDEDEYSTILEMK